MFRFINISYLFFLLIFIFLQQNAHSKENYILNWDKLIPENAYDFIPEDGGTDELWQDKSFLKKLDIAGLKINKKMVGKKIKLYGFMVPLKTDYTETLIVNEFVLVPTAGMCIHVPPPPPNQMVFVKLNKPEKARYMYNPISVEGILINTPPIKEVYNSIYEMKVDKILDINEEKYLKTIDELQNIDNL